MEEIEDVDGNSSDRLVADAVANEKELILSEEQRKKFRKVCLYTSNNDFFFITEIMNFFYSHIFFN